ncbi:MAG: cytochrome c [Ferruginibacter sp.]
MPQDKQNKIIAVLLTTGFLLYSFTIYSSLPVKNNYINEETSNGKLVWQKYNCNACHQVYGLGGYLGPDLTNSYSLRGAGYIKAFLISGTTVMPNFNLSEQEVNALLAYLKNIDASGNADPRSFTIKYNGTIGQ